MCVCVSVCVCIGGGVGGAMGDVSRLVSSQLQVWPLFAPLPPPPPYTHQYFKHSFAYVHICHGGPVCIDVVLNLSCA